MGFIAEVATKLLWQCIPLIKSSDTPQSEPTQDELSEGKTED